MKTGTRVELMKIVRYGLVSIFIFMGAAFFSPRLRAQEKTDVKAAPATDVAAPATGSVEVVEYNEGFVEEYQACMEADLTEKDMPTVMKYYSQYPDEMKAAVVQTGQCLAMMAEDGALCGLFKDIKPGTVYKIDIAPPGATSTAALKPVAAPENFTAIFPADVDGCLILRESGGVVRRAVENPEDCPKEFSGYCKKHLAKLSNPNDKSFSCDNFSKAMCDMINVDEVTGCDVLAQKYGSPKVTDFCYKNLRGEMKGASSITNIIWLGGALKNKQWPVLSSDFITDSIQLDPAYVVYAGAVKKSNSCFSPMSDAMKSDICTRIAKDKVGVKTPDK